MEEKTYCTDLILTMLIKIKNFCFAPCNLTRVAKTFHEVYVGISVL